jgi:hypothetical protein
MKVIVQQTKDGKILITSISYETTFEQVLNSLPKDTTAFVTESENLPEDVTFFNAWELDGEEVVVNLTKAREIWKDRLRQARKPVLEKLDIEYMRALENEDTTRVEEIVSVKKKLRDITVAKELTSAKSIENIKAFWPSVLETDKV